MSNRKPNLFIVGAPKCGTSALAEYLKQHPQVFICEPKEPFFWSSDYPGLQARHGMDSLERYLSLFENATASQTMIGEGSTNYLRSEVAIREIMEFNPDAKFIVMLRNPVEVVHAFHSEVSFSYIENEPDFEKAWRLQESRANGKNLPPNCEAPQFLQYSQVASYASQIESFFDLVPEDQRQVIIFDDFKADNAGVFKQTQEFLGLELFHKEEFERVNAAHGHRSKLVAKLVLDPPNWLRPVVEQARKYARQQQGGWIDQVKHWFRKPQKRTPLSNELRTELADHFRQDVERLSQTLDRDLTHWVDGSGKTSTASNAVDATKSANHAERTLQEVG